MANNFQFIALPFERFAPLFALSDSELLAMGAQRMLADANPGFPCRVSLTDAEVGETVLLLAFTHHDMNSPYRASGPIFVRAAAKTATPAIGEVPKMFIHRELSVRAYDAGGMMVEADIVCGPELASTIPKLFSDTRVSYIHIHNAKPGCYNCKVVRA